jgi:glycosyltransferase involved in cell wall biosynthesis
VIPAYRAERHIAGVLSEIPGWVRHIVVVDDLSPDGTADVVQACTDPRVHLIRQDANQGVGGATLTGYRLARELGAEILVKMDSDGQMDPRHLSTLIAPIVRGEADYTKGNRFAHTRQISSMPLVRRIGNAGLSFLTKAASGYWHVFDPSNGYTAIHASVLELLDDSAIDRRYFFETSLLLELSLARAVVRDVYMPARYGDEISSLSATHSLIAFPPRLLSALAHRLWVQHIVRDFSVIAVYGLVGAAMALFGGAWGLWHWIRNSQLHVETPTGTVMLAVLPLLLGIQLLLQAVTLDVQSVPTRPVHLSAPAPNGANSAHSTADG